MSGCLISCRSVTYARKAEKLLSKKGITARVVRPPSELSKGECSVSLKVAHKSLPSAVDCLKRNYVPFGKIYIYYDDFGYREVEM